MHRSLNVGVAFACIVGVALAQSTPVLVESGHNVLDRLALNVGAHVGPVDADVSTGNKRNGPSVDVDVGGKNGGVGAHVGTSTNTNPPNVDVDVDVDVTGPTTTKPPAPPATTIPADEIRNLIDGELDGLSPDQLKALKIACADVLAHPDRYSPIKVAICELVKAKAG